MKLKHKNLGVLWNLHKYVIDYSNNLGMKPQDIDEKLVSNMFSMEEKYILSKLNSAIKAATTAFDEYLLNEVPWIAEELFLELSRTYIQLVREKAATGEDGKSSRRSGAGRQPPTRAETKEAQQEVL